MDKPADESASATGEPRVLYEDTDLLAVEKPAGLVAHPTYKHPDGTLADAIFARQEARGEGRPWLLHRLDRETSGVVLFAKSARARRALVRQFEHRTVRKRYLAVAAGVPEPAEGMIEAPLARDPADRRRTIVVEGGQPASTRYRVLATSRGETGDASNYALVLLAPITGRTHQLRAHLAWLGTPIAGDVRYVGEAHPSREFAPRALLHAWRLRFRHPATGEPMELVAPLPADLGGAIERLELQSGLSRAATRDWEDEA